MSRVRKKAPPRHGAVTTAVAVLPDIVRTPALAKPIASFEGRSVLEVFLLDKHAKTAKGYRGALGDFAGWAMWPQRDKASAKDVHVGAPGGHGVADDDIVAVLDQFLRMTSPEANELVLRFRAYLEARGLASRTVNHKLTVLRSYASRARLLGVCHFEIVIPNVEQENARDTSGPGEEGYMVVDEWARERLAMCEAALSACARDKSSTPKVLRAAKRKMILAARDLAFLTLWFHAGMRRFEALSSLYPVDVDLQDMAKARLRFRGKKRKQKEWQAINKRCALDIQAYIRVRDIGDGPLFYSTHPSHYGARMNERTMNKVLFKMADGAGIKVTPHGLRHSAATTLLEKTDGNVRAVAEFLRHKGLDVVQVYDDNRKQLARRMGDLLAEDTNEKRKRR